MTQDPDLGAWVYQYNGFGDLVVQGDGKWQPTFMTYDTLGRMVQRDDDAEPHGGSTTSPRTGSESSRRW